MLRCFNDRPFGQQNKLVLPISVFDKCVSRMEKAIELYETDSPNSELILIADFLYTLSDVNDVFDDLHNSVQNVGVSELIDKTLLYINENLADIRKTDEVAKALYVSREYLSRTFSRENGTTLGAYILKKKSPPRSHCFQPAFPRPRLRYAADLTIIRILFKFSNARLA